MNVTTVTDGIYRLSANMRDILFEGLWPIPNGVSMNSYIVKGEKTAIVDGVCGWDGVPETLFAQLDKIDVPLESIDYVIVNHMEPDHSGWIDDFKKIRQDFTIVTSQKAVPLMEAFFDITNDIMVVGDGDTLDLGDGRVLAFAEIPNVHWPETIATFDTKSGTLMPCDAFGSFGAIDDAPYDDQLTQEQIDFFEQEAIRYYSNIVAAFSVPARKAIEKAAPLPIKIIAPGHGIVWRKDPMKIVNDYLRYTSYQKGPLRRRSDDYLGFHVRKYRNGGGTRRESLGRRRTESPCASGSRGLLGRYHHLGVEFHGSRAGHAHLRIQDVSPPWRPYSTSWARRKFSTAKRSDSAPTAGPAEPRKNWMRLSRSIR
jgi:hypothetical protein